MVTQQKIDLDAILDDLVGPAEDGHEFQARVTTLLHYQKLFDAGMKVPEQSTLEIMVGEYYDGVLDTLRVLTN